MPPSVCWWPRLSSLSACCSRTSGPGARAWRPRCCAAPLHRGSSWTSSSLAPAGVYRAACANLVRPRGPWARDAVWHAAAPSSGARLRSAQGGAFNAVWSAACGPVLLFGVGVCAPWTSPHGRAHVAEKRGAPPRFHIMPAGAVCVQCKSMRRPVYGRWGNVAFGGGVVAGLALARLWLAIPSPPPAGDTLVCIMLCGRLCGD